VVQDSESSSDSSASSSDMSSSSGEEDDQRARAWPTKHNPSPVVKGSKPKYKPTDRQQPQCTHCGSTKHVDLYCWSRITCQKCGLKGHPTDRCLRVCKCCGDLHEPGKCKLEEIVNRLRSWYNPTEHSGILPPEIEKSLN
jgi:hypothetical protein